MSTALIMLSVGVATLVTRLPGMPVFVGSASVGFVAMALREAMTITGHMNWMVHCFTNAEADMSRVERLHTFCKLKNEGELSSTVATRTQWPAGKRHALPPRSLSVGGRSSRTTVCCACAHLPPTTQLVQWRSSVYP